MNYDEQKLKVNDTLHRLELEIEGSIAFIEYKLSRDMLFLIHTEVPQVQQVLLCKRHCSTRKDNNYKIVPIFPFCAELPEKT